MVTVSFDPTLIAKPESMEPKPVVKPTGAGDAPRQRRSPRTPRIPSTSPTRRRRKTRSAREKTDYEKKIADGQKKVDGLRRPVRPVVLRHAGRELPLDQPGPRRAGRAQEAARRGRGTRRSGRIARRAAARVSAARAAAVRLSAVVALVRCQSHFVDGCDPARRRSIAGRADSTNLRLATDTCS